MARKERRNSIEIADADIAMRNFSGKKNDYNPEGQRNFSVMLEEDLAARLKADGWNVKRTKPTLNDPMGVPFLPVRVSFDNYPPAIYILRKDSRILLPEAELSMLDAAEIISADLVINPSAWQKNGNSGIKAYLAEMYVTLATNRFAEKYRDLPISDPSRAD